MYTSTVQLNGRCRFTINENNHGSQFYVTIYFNNILSNFRFFCDKNSRILGLLILYCNLNEVFLKRLHPTVENITYNDKPR